MWHAITYKNRRPQIRGPRRVAIRRSAIRLMASGSTPSREDVQSSPSGVTDPAVGSTARGLTTAGFLLLSATEKDLEWDDADVEGNVALSCKRTWVAARWKLLYTREPALRAPQEPAARRHRRLKKNCAGPSRPPPGTPQSRDDTRILAPAHYQFRPPPSSD